MFQRLGSYVLVPAQLSYNKKIAKEGKQNLLNKYDTEEVSIVTQDKIKLNGMLIKNPNSSNDDFSKRKLLIKFGGNGDWYEKKGINKYEIEKINNLGKDILFFNYRGVGKSQGSPTPKGLIKDGQAVLNFAVSKKYEPKNITVDSFSLGGAVATKVLAAEKEKFKESKFICDRTFSSIKNVINNKKTWKIVKLFLSFLLFISSWNIDIIKDWKEVKCSKVVLFSNSDEVIPTKGSLAHAIKNETDERIIDLKNFKHNTGINSEGQKDCLKYL